MIPRGVRFFLFFGLALALVQCQVAEIQSIAPDAGVVTMVKQNGKKVARDFDLECLGFGHGQLLDVDPPHPEGLGTIWAINLVDHKKLTLDEARIEILAIYDDYKRLTANNPEFLSEYQIYTDAMGDPLFHEGKIGIKLAFWDENVDRPWPPYVAQIRVSEGTIKYFFVADETQKLGEPYIETIAEARMKAREG